MGFIDARMVEDIDGKNISDKIGILSRIIISIEEFPRQIPEVDDTGRFQRALDSLEGKGGLIFAEAKEYVISQIKFPSYTGLIGVSKKTVFKMADNNDKPMMVLKTNTAQMVVLKDFIINGNRTNQTSSAARGIEFINTTSSSSMKANSLVGEHDCRHFIDNIQILETKGDGLYIEGRGETQIRSVQTLRCDGVGIYANSADTWYNDCSAGDSGYEGIYVGTVATNNRFVNCKAWFSGRLDYNRGTGFEVKADRVCLVACEAQDNSKHGFSFSGRDIVGAGLMAEANGWYYDGTVTYTRSDSTGFFFYGSENCNIQGMACDRFGPSSPYQNYAVQFLNGAKNNKAIVTSRYAKTAAIPSSQLYDGNNNQYDIIEIKTDETVKQWTQMRRINVNIGDNAAVTAFYTRSLQSLGHQYGAITRFDTDTQEVTVQRWEKYDAAGSAKNRWDLKIDHVNKKATFTPLDGGSIGVASPFFFQVVTTRPSSPFEGMVVYDQNIKKPIVYDGTGWKDFLGNAV